MKRIAWSVLIAPLVCLSGTAFAQDDDEAIGFAYVTYFECDAGREYRADEIIELNYKPHYDAAVEAGDISQWSWLTHFVGGKWRRALVLTAANMDDLLASAGALGEVLEATTLRLAGTSHRYARFTRTTSGKPCRVPVVTSGLKGAVRASAST